MAIAKSKGFKNVIVPVESVKEVIVPHQKKKCLGSDCLMSKVGFKSLYLEATYCESCD